jgi:hypothetical protein
MLPFPKKLKLTNENAIYSNQSWTGVTAQGIVLRSAPTSQGLVASVRASLTAAKLLQ